MRWAGSPCSRCLTWHSEDEFCSQSELWWAHFFCLKLFTLIPGGGRTRKVRDICGKGSWNAISKVFFANWSGSRYSWEYLGVSGIWMISNRLFDLGTGDFHACSYQMNTQRVTLPVAYHKMIWHVLQSHNFHHETFSYHVWSPNCISVFKRKKKTIHGCEKEIDVYV